VRGIPALSARKVCRRSLRLGQELRSHKGMLSRDRDHHGREITTGLARASLGELLDQRLDQ